MRKRRIRNRPAIAPGLTAAVVLSILASLPAIAYAPPGRTERISISASGGEAAGPSWGPTITPDGRYVAFASEAEDLVPNDANQRADVFLRDLAAGTTTRVSVTAAGGDPDGHSLGPSVSSDGRYVAFHSDAPNLVPGGGVEGERNVYVRDLERSATQVVSVGNDGAAVGGSHPSISADGTRIAFITFASLDPKDTNFTFDVYVRDLAAGTTVLASVGPGGVIGQDYSTDPVLSADGNVVAFWSAAALVPEDTNNSHDVYARDLGAERTDLASVGLRGKAGDSDALFGPSLSTDGRIVAFWSWATDLVPGDTNAWGDVFVRDRTAGVTERVSVSSGGSPGNDESSLPAVSADGRYVAFGSYASNLIPGDTNEGPDTFVHDRLTGATERVSVNDAGGQAGAAGPSDGVVQALISAVSTDGQVVAFDSEAQDLVGDDTNEVRDVFLRRRGPSLGFVGVSARSHPDGVRVEGAASFSGDRVVDLPDDPADGRNDLGAEITAGSVAARPHREDVFVRIALASLPPKVVPGFLRGGAVDAAAYPGIVYGAELRSGQVRYEVRALRSAATANPPLAPASVTLWRCEPDCVQVAVLDGGIGSTGKEVTFALPLSLLGPVAPARLTHLRVFAAIGESAAGGVRLLDELILSDAPLPSPRVEVGAAPDGTPEQEVVFRAASLEEGRFSAILPAAGPGSELWARACFGDDCATTRLPAPS